MEFNEFLSLIVSEAYVVIPVLLILGTLLKQTPNVNDWLIPYILLIVGVGFSIALLGTQVSSIIQGVLVTGAAVFSHQLFKQYKEKEGDDK
ncbi:phage holin family protein [Anaerobacillus isosaccharinicus]|uniref:Holin n=1 Tax=Anaerobacillus isosaccharinicus TaxID=1532552 RepID=A0A1S2MF93_9BACI|nr:phage holin family protein [Anaerobacillus isosaccharinicus]MBA5588596.1 phage holin family protein [Anaerobacillus isosaccharinicus]QOY37991.1 phage holin family protein [Anaerobacillus isosaccharinicus]